MRRSHGNATRGTSEVELARSARTVIAGSHVGLLTAGSAARQVAYLDDDGEPVLLCPAADPVLGRSAHLTVWGDGSRRVVLGGRLLPLAREDSMVTELLGLHGPCFADHLRREPVRLLRLAVDSVAFEAAHRSHEVSAASFATAEPDLWAAFGRAVARHLNESHSDLVNRLARKHVSHEPVAAAAITALAPNTIELAVITRSGGSQVRIAMEERLSDPHDMCRHLRLLGLIDASSAGPDGH